MASGRSGLPPQSRPLPVSVPVNSSRRRLYSLAEHEADFTAADADVARRNVGVLSDDAEARS